MKHYTCNVSGHHIGLAKSVGLHAYYANGVTAIELTAQSKKHAGQYLRSLGLDVLYIFE